MNKVAQFRACLHINGKWKAKITHRALGFVFYEVFQFTFIDMKENWNKTRHKTLQDSRTLTHETDQLPVLIVFG